MIKRLFFLMSAWVMIGLNVSAQQLYIQGGLNGASLLVKEDGETISDDFKYRIGFNLGLVAEYPVSKSTYFQTGLIFSQKGYRLNEDFFGEDITAKVVLNYVDIPLTFKFASERSEQSSVYGLIGPYLSFGLQGKTKVTYDGDSDSEVVEWGDDPEKDNFRRFDAGLKLGAGVDAGQFNIQASYSLGLAHISPYTEDDYQVKHRYFQFSVLVPI